MVHGGEKSLLVRQRQEFQEVSFQFPGRWWQQNWTFQSKQRDIFQLLSDCVFCLMSGHFPGGQCHQTQIF